MPKTIKPLSTQKPSASPFPLKPMLATRIEEPFNDPDWIYEIKLDGYRIISEVINNKASILSRGQLNFTSKYPPIAEALSKIKFNAVFDGEAIVIGKDSMFIGTTWILHNNTKSLNFITITFFLISNRCLNFLSP